MMNCTLKKKLKSFLMTALDKNNLCTDEQLKYLYIFHPEIMNEIISFNEFCENILFEKIIEEGRTKKIISNDLDNKAIVRVFINSLKDIVINTNNKDFEKSLKLFNDTFEIILKGISKYERLLC